jgi:hypothetical protein
MRILAFLAGIIAIIIGSAYFARSHTISALTNTGSVYEAFQQTDSGWLYSNTIGSETASGIERARIALGGPLGLSAQEAVYFIAQTDNADRRLNSSCAYTVTGTPIATRWWSLTLYDSDTQNYVENDLRRSSWNNVAIPRNEAGGWVINVSGNAADDTWLPTQTEADKPFELILRLYNPSAELRAALPEINLPVVERLSCR